MYCKSHEQAVRQGITNARLAGTDYIVFFDTAGNVRLERSAYAPRGIQGTITVVRPDGSTKDYPDAENTLWH